MLSVQNQGISASVNTGVSRHRDGAGGFDKAFERRTDEQGDSYTGEY
jgi:hypothetical protein